MTLRIPSGDTNQGYSWRSVPGLNTANFTVYRSRNGATAVAFTTPTISEDSTVTGMYHLTLDEDMTITAGNLTEQVKCIIRHPDAPDHDFDFELVAVPVRRNATLSAFTFLMVDADGVPLSGLSVTATRSIDGAAFGACANAVSQISNGAYKIDLAAADMNGANIHLRFTATGARDRHIVLRPA